MNHGRKILYIVITVLVLGLILGYGLFQARKVIAGPEIKVTSIENDAIVSGPTVEIKGYATNVAFLYLDGKQIYTNDSGVFDEVTIVATGTNVLELEAKDKFGREVDKILTIFRNN